MINKKLDLKIKFHNEIKTGLDKVGLKNTKNLFITSNLKQI